MGDLKQIDSPEKEFMSISELSNYLDMSKNTIYYFVHNKKWPFYKLGKKILFKVSEIRALIESGRVSSNGEIQEAATIHALKMSPKNV